MSLTANQFLSILRKHIPGLDTESERSYKCLIAYSGGMDSHVLLHLCASIRDKLPTVEFQAIHINHGLSQYADKWEAHCQKVCEQLDFSYTTKRVSARAMSGESPEDKARELRYSSYASIMNNDDILLQAHHQDDQAETLLLQLLRGSGPHGGAAMPEITPFATGQLLRPLLGFTRQQLKHYAEQQQLNWIDDESNFDTAIDRNYLRHEVVPVVQNRWPAMSQTLARAANHYADTARLLDHLAEMDLQLAADDDGLLIPVLKQWDDARQANLIRYWLRCHNLPVPQATQLDHVLRDVVNSAPDRIPCVRWPGVEIRRYREHLYAMPPLIEHDSQLRQDWDFSGPLSFRVGKLQAQSVKGTGLSQKRCGQGQLSVGFRRGGEICQPVNRTHHHELKKLFQEQGVPPWLRDRIPLVFVDDQLAEVVGYWICDPFQAAADEPGVKLRWQPN